MLILWLSGAANLGLVVVLCILLRGIIRRWLKRLGQDLKDRKPRIWRPKSPEDCPHCVNGICITPMRTQDVIPYRQQKSKRGRTKTVATQGFACPNPECTYCGISDDAVHALVGYGRQSNIQRFKCQACGKVFTSRCGTPLYYLKTNPDRIELVLFFLAEGCDASVLVRYTGHCDATIARWLQRMGHHSSRWHDVLFRNLALSFIQLDELYTRVRDTASATWVWLAIDATTKLIPAMHIGGRTRDDAFALVHDLEQRLDSQQLPAFTTDGLRSYFYALTAHFGFWHRPPRARKDHWVPDPRLLHGQLVKRKHRRGLRFAITRMMWGTRAALNTQLRALAHNPIIQTAFIERVNLTFRQGIAPLGRRTWAYAQTIENLQLHCEWFRLYYHLVRTHQSLTLRSPASPSREQTPAMAAGITDHIWSIHDLLHYPVPQVA
jgi:transposase-like protein/IS1 family transposase